MSERINDGGAAFPLPIGYNPNNGNQVVAEQYGMTLRDYFAGKALAGYFAAPHTPHRCECYDVATYCYQMADAMIAARDGVK